MLILGALSLFSFGCVSAAHEDKPVSSPLSDVQKNVDLWEHVRFKGKPIILSDGREVPVFHNEVLHLYPETLTGEEEHITMRGLNNEKTMRATRALADRNKKMRHMEIDNCSVTVQGAQNLAEVIKKNQDLTTIRFSDRELGAYWLYGDYLDSNAVKLLFDALFEHPGIAFILCEMEYARSEEHRLFLDFVTMLNCIASINQAWLILLHSDVAKLLEQDTFSTLMRDIRATYDFAKDDAIKIKERVRDFIEKLPEEKFDDYVNEKIHKVKVAFEHIVELGQPYSGPYLWWEKC